LRAHWLDFLIVSPEEMGVILEETGWKVLKIINTEEAVYYVIIDKD